jgi:hypothetical protein
MIKKQLKSLTPALTTTVLLALGQTALAHTSLETSTMSEGVRVVNNVQIGHACSATKRVIATSVVFPEGTGSIITAGGQPYSGPLTDFVSNWGPNIQPLFSRAAFDEVDEKYGSTGSNVVGLWAGGGPGMPNHMVAYVPFRVNATNIVPTSCATSVRFTVNIVDICNITKAADMHVEGPDGPSVEFWTQTGTDSPFYGSVNNAASLTITRNLTTNPLPTSCGTGLAVTVAPTAAQLTRDMPIKYKGIQVWPAP